MKKIPFEKLYNTEFFITEAMVKPQNWFFRANTYNALGRPKISHTLLWFKNCSAEITDKSGKVFEIRQNQLAYMSKGTEYIVRFKDTNPDKEDTVVIHFQMTDASGEDIMPTSKPIVAIKHLEPSFAISMDKMCEEFRKNIVCIPEANALIYKLLAEICKKRKTRATRDKYACIGAGIELMEQDSDMSIAEIARNCGVSECYFRKLFREYSGESPISFRMRHRIEKAKMLLASDEQLTIGEIASELNFSDIYHFSSAFKKIVGISPRDYIKGIKK